MADERPVPVKTILVTIGLVVASFVTLWMIVALAHIWTLMVVALFFAILFTPPVDFVRRHLHVSKGVATTIVLFLTLGLLTGLMYAFIAPLVNQTQHFVDKFPTYLEDAKAGRGPVGHLVRKYELDKKFEENRGKLNDAVSGAGSSVLKYSRKVFAGVISSLTVLVLAILMILYGPQMLANGLGALSPPRQERSKAVARDCARALSGYAMGNLLISVIAGAFTFIALWIFGVPFKGVLALFVGFCDLIPLIGATLGAIPTILVAFLHSTTAGVGMIIVYVVYQQFENHVLQVAIMSKTVNINQLVVITSVLIGVELAGFLGALLAIPAAGVLQVVARDLWDNRTGRMKQEPTIGVDEVPVSEVIDEEQGADEHDEQDGQDGQDGQDAPPSDPPAALPVDEPAPVPHGD